MGAGVPMEVVDGARAGASSNRGGAVPVRSDRESAGSPKLDRRERVVPLVLGSVVALVWAPLFHRLASRPGASSLGFNDFPTHLELSRQFSLVPLRLITPNPVFYSAVAILRPLIGEAVAATVVCAAAAGACAALLVHLLRFADREGCRLGLPAATAVAVFLMFAEAPNIVLGVLGISPLDGLYPVAHFWGSPTETVGLPFLLFLLLLVLRALEADVITQRMRIQLGAVALVTPLAKPTYLLVLLPALVLVVGTTRGWRSEIARTLWWWLVVPVGLISVWQAWFSATGHIPVATVGIELAPLVVVRRIGLLRAGPWFFLAPMFVVLAAWIGRRRFLRDDGVAISLVAFLISLAPLFLVAETGNSRYSGNTLKPAWVAWSILFVFAARHMAIELSAARSRRAGSRHLRPLWLGLVVAYCALAFLGGFVVFAGDSFG